MLLTLSAAAGAARLPGLACPPAPHDYETPHHLWRIHRANLSALSLLLSRTTRHNRSVPVPISISNVHRQHISDSVPPARIITHHTTHTARPISERRIASPTGTPCYPSARSSSGSGGQQQPPQQPPPSARSHHISQLVISQPPRPYRSHPHESAHVSTTPRLSSSPLGPSRQRHALPSLSPTLITLTLLSPYTRQLTASAGDQIDHTRRRRLPARRRDRARRRALRRGHAATEAAHHAALPTPRGRAL